MDLLSKAKRARAKPCSTPLSTSKIDHEFLLLENAFEYRSLVSALQYFTWIRSDLSFVVNLVCQFMQNPRISHHQAVKPILRYLKGFIDVGLWSSKCSTDPSFIAFSDADWAGCALDRRSTGGYCIFMGNSLIS